MQLQELYEAKASGKAIGTAMMKIVSYLEKKLGTKLVRIPGIERYSNSAEKGYGLRYVFSGSTKSLRFNWKSPGAVGKASELMSINFWDGTRRDPSFTIRSEGVSLVQVLPALVKHLANPRVGRFTVFPTSAQRAGPALVEDARAERSAETALSDALSKMRAGKSFTRDEFIAAYDSSNVGAFDVLVSDFANKLDISGNRVTVRPDVDTAALIRAVLDRAGALIVTPGGSNERYEETPAEKQVSGRVPFVETLEHLENLVKALVHGAFNSLFVGGRPGTGKTQTVENTLAQLGLMDGIGYFKNTGSASASGIYTLLYQHRNDIILFDDADGALADQDARNIIKAATDTKKRRKLVWNKKSPFIFDPDVDDPEKYEDDPSMAPKYFNFEGKIIFITNLPLSKLDPDGALRTRAFIIIVDPTDEELFDRMKELLHKIKLEDGLTLSREQREKVLEVVKRSRRQGDVSLRKLVRALNLAAAGVPNWPKLVELYA